MCTEVLKTDTPWNFNGLVSVITLSACSTYQDTCLSLKRREGYQAQGKLFYLWLWSFMVISKVRENENFNELVQHAALWWFLHTGQVGVIKIRINHMVWRNSRWRQNCCHPGRKVRPKLCFEKPHAVQSVPTLSSRRNSTSTCVPRETEKWSSKWMKQRSGTDSSLWFKLSVWYRWGCSTSLVSRKSSAKWGWSSKCNLGEDETASNTTQHSTAGPLQLPRHRK